MQNVFNVCVFEENFIEKLDFGRSGLHSSVFEKLLILMHFIHEKLCFEEFLH